MSVTFTGEIHPLADELPMLPADELHELAQDIATNGLTDPLTLDADGRLLDGRNRLAACGIAGVEPSFVVYEGDPVSLVVSRGALRRNITSAQRAMLIAKDMWRRGLWNEDTQRWRQGAAAQVGASAQTSSHDLKLCGAILAHREAWATDILKGVKQLRAAYDQALQERRDEAEAEQQRETLRTEAPDLYRYLTSEPHPMPLDEAWAAYLERTREQRKRDEELAALIVKQNADVQAAFATITTLAHVENRTRVMDNYTPLVKTWTSADLHDLADTLHAIADDWSVS